MVNININGKWGGDGGRWSRTLNFFIIYIWQSALIHILPLSPMSSSLTAHFEVFWMGEQKLNKNRGKANKSHGNWI
jgi:hypothetical protein